MRVLHIVLGLEIGGLEAFVLDLTKSYRDSVDSVIVCLRGSGQVMAKDTQHATIINMEGPESFSWRIVWRLSRLIRDQNIDLVHTHNPGPHLYGALAGRLSGKPVLHTKHGRNYPDKPRKVVLNRIATLLTHRIIAVSHDAELVCREIESVPDSKLRTILNGTNLQDFLPRPSSGEVRRQLGIADETALLGIVARLSRIKNHRLLFDSMEELRGRGVNAQLVVVGDGPLEKDLRNHVTSRGMETQIHFLGARSDVETLYPQFDLFVLSSMSEGVSLTLLEAMSCEVPVVATRVGGNPEVVEHGVTGLIVEETVDSIASAIESLVSAPNWRESLATMGKAGRQRVAETFSMEQTAEAYLQEYGRLTGNYRGSASQ
jgi:glycosyltransferase involved in cell wall biosynthesis